MICVPNSLDVDGKKVLITEITYNDLIVLYKKFIDKNNRTPTLSECTSKNNLPQRKIINKILKDCNITYNDFLLQFGKVARVRTTDVHNYDNYVKRFIDICKESGKTLTSEDLINNRYGLPSANWLVEHCPDSTVNSYGDFIQYCGLKQRKIIWNKDAVADILLKYEKNIGRPLLRNDIKPQTVGFSIIVLNRLYGSFGKAKKEIGLMKTIRNQPLPFEYYKNALTTIVLNYKYQTNKKYITWKEIESGKYGDAKIKHKAFISAFKREKVDLHSYIHSLGCMMNPSSFSYTYTFPDGERINSNYEYDVTVFLRKIGFSYNINYFRSILYKSFSDEKSKINCDYVLKVGSENLYIEVAGVIDNRHNDWKVRNYSTNIENNYRDKMIIKENIFKNQNLHYLLLFSDDMENEKFQEIILNKIKEFKSSIKDGFY